MAMAMAIIGRIRKCGLTRCKVNPIVLNRLSLFSPPPPKRGNNGQDQKPSDEAPGWDAAIVRLIRLPVLVSFHQFASGLRFQHQFHDDLVALFGGRCEPILVTGQSLRCKLALGRRLDGNRLARLGKVYDLNPLPTCDFAVRVVQFAMDSVALAPQFHQQAVGEHGVCPPSTVSMALVRAGSDFAATFERHFAKSADLNFTDQSISFDCRCALQSHWHRYHHLRLPP